MAEEERDPREPYGMPKELAVVWRKHRKLADKYMEEHESWGFGEKYYNLARKHEAVCDYLERAGANESARSEYRALKDRINKLPADYDEHGNATHVVEAVRKLKHDMAASIF